MLFGDESVSTLLRLLVAGELYFNSSFYAAHEAFTETSRSNPELYPDVLFTVALTKRGDRKFTETGDRDEAVKEEALLVCEVGKWSSLVHIMGMASVLSRPIISVYPSVEIQYRCLVNRVINPRPSAISTLPKEEAIHILCSRDGNLDNRPNSWYTPNHFVPLCVVTAESPASEKQDFPSTSTSGTQKPKQGTLFSFLKPKASSSGLSAISPNAPPEKPKVSKRSALTAGHRIKKEEPSVKKIRNTKLSRLETENHVQVEGRVSLADYSRGR